MGKYSRDKIANEKVLRRLNKHKQNHFHVITYFGLFLYFMLEWAYVYKIIIILYESRFDLIDPSFTNQKHKPKSWFIIIYRQSLFGENHKLGYWKRQIKE